ncbi:MAG: flavodoxin domain-containing protein [Pseudomonadota bacterium]
MKRVLITYATREGQTEKIAHYLREHLSSSGAKVTLVNASDAAMLEKLNLSAFELLVFGASLHAGSLEREMLDFLQHHSPQIGAKNRSFFLVLLSAAATDPEKRQAWLADARHKVQQKLPVQFTDFEMIAGALAYSRYSFPVRWMMKRIARQAGHLEETPRDHEFTDWDQVTRYAQRLLSALEESQSE